MSALELNDALQRATREGNWICWHAVFDGCRHVDDKAMLCNCRGHAVLGMASEGFGELLARMPEAEAALDAL